MARPVAPRSGSSAPPHTRAVETFQRSTGVLSTAATAEMERNLLWFGELSAEERSWVGLIVQAGVRGFVEWYAAAAYDAGPEGRDPMTGGSALATAIFGAAPRALAGVISLQQTVDLIRVSIEVVEREAEVLLDPEDAPHVRVAIARYAREVAFATAEVYARAAEVRGAWDARLEALVVDAVLRAETDETVLSRASALGWTDRGAVVVVLGAVPVRRTETGLFDEVRRVARTADMDALCAVQGERLVVVLGGVDDPRAAAGVVAELFGAGPVVVGPKADGLDRAAASARAALSGHRASGGWPEAPRPALSVELLPERALAGDGQARRYLVDEIYLPMVRTRGAMVETVAAYLRTGGSIEGTARALFVHPNTVRYRLRAVSELTGFSPTVPRDAFTLEIALVLGRLSGRQE